MNNRLMGRRRSSIDILHDILKLCSDGGIKKTAIMYRGNLSYDQLRRYLTVLVGQEIVARNELGDYRVTAKGQYTLRRISTVIEALSDLRTELGPIADAETATESANGPLEEQPVLAAAL